jgi:hypothetical protein
LSLTVTNAPSLCKSAAAVTPLLAKPRTSTFL